MAHLKTRTVRGERRYDVCWREHGKSKSKTFMRRADAEKYRLDVARRAQLGTLYEAETVTVQAARDDWRSRWMLGKSASTVERKDDAWKHADAIAHVPLASLTPALLDDTIATVARKAPRQAQILGQTIAQVLRDAQRRGQRFAPELLEIRAPGYDEREPVFLTMEEVDIVASWCTEPRLLVFLALSGLRIGEALALRDTEIDRKSRSLLVVRAARAGVEGRTKTKKRRRVYLCDVAWQALLEQLVARTVNTKGLVFPSPMGKLWNSDNFRARVFAKAVEHATTDPEEPDEQTRIALGRRDDVARLTLHDLRHSFASLMIAADANPMQIAEALGHSDRNGRPDATLVWKRYGHLYEGSAREAATRLDTYLEALAS